MYLVLVIGIQQKALDIFTLDTNFLRPGLEEICSNPLKKMTKIMKKILKKYISIHLWKYKKKQSKKKLKKIIYAADFNPLKTKQKNYYFFFVFCFS